MGLVMRIIVILLVGSSLGLGAYFLPAVFVPEPQRKSYSARITTGGSSSVYFIQDMWKRAYQEKWRNDHGKDNEIDVQYTSTGSGAGFKKTIDNEYQIGFISTPLTKEQQDQASAKGGPLVQVPILLGAVVPVYNLAKIKDKPPLNFTGELLAKIFLGKIDKWNHEEIKKINPHVKDDLPDESIIVVYRSDRSGTTHTFTDYLNGASKTWHDQIGSAQDEGKVFAGKTSVGKERNFAVSDQVGKTNGAIGYVELLHATRNKLQFGAVRNKADTEYIHCKPKNVTAAAKDLVKVSQERSFQLTNMPGPDSYPICTIDYAICHQNQPPAQQKLVVDYLHWVTHEGQKIAMELDYAPLPDELVQRADQQLKAIKSVQ